MFCIMMRRKIIDASWQMTNSVIYDTREKAEKRVIMLRRNYSPFWLYQIAELTPLDNPA